MNKYFYPYTFNTVNEGQKRSLADEALSKIQEAIVSGKLRPNHCLVESSLAKKLGMSRTPLREAIRRLEIIGYVTIHPNGRATVTDHSPKEIRDMYELREALETIAIKLACDRVIEKDLVIAQEYNILANKAATNLDYEKFSQLNDQFHNALLNSCGNKKLLSLIGTSRDQYYDKKILRIMTSVERRRILRQHDAVLEALSNRNVKKAQKIIQDHIKMMMRIAIERL
jgi:DNA-binding GntR family transcriptional regulator